MPELASIEWSSFVILYTMFKHWNRFLSSVTKDGKNDPKDEHELRLFEVFSLTLCLQKITQKIVMGHAAWWDLLDILVKSLTENICDLGTEMTKNSNILVT